MTRKPPQSVRDQGQRWLRLSLYKLRKRDKRKAKALIKDVGSPASAGPRGNASPTQGGWAW
jgi:hypothetical protein